MDQSEHKNYADKLLAEYSDAAYWIITNRQTEDALLLRKLMLSLNSPRFKYAVAFDCTERMSTSSAALAMELIQHRLEHGICEELARVCTAMGH